MSRRRTRTRRPFRRLVFVFVGRDLVDRGVDVLLDRFDLFGGLDLCDLRDVFGLFGLFGFLEQGQLIDRRCADRQSACGLLDDVDVEVFGFDDLDGGRREHHRLLRLVFLFGLSAS